MESTILNGWKTIRFDEDMMSVEQETVATEYPLTVYINGIEFATMVCTPIDLRELIIGFLASEGIIRFVNEIDSINIDEERGLAYVELHKEINQLSQDHSKRFIGSCCGKSRQFYFKSDVQTAKTITSDLTISSQQCLKLMRNLQNKSNHFKETGGVHNAALATVDKILSFKTDIGRHNALDKVYGHILENKMQLSDKVIVFSGRISSEVLLKISKMGIAILISKSAPTDLALKLAKDLGITAIGFARGNKMNVYTHAYRVYETNEQISG